MIEEKNNIIFFIKVLAFYYLQCYNIFVFNKTKGDSCMKKLLTVTLLVVLMLTIATTTMAATESELLAYVSKTFTIAGEEVSISASDKVKVERYLNEYEVTEEQADQVVAKIDEVVAIMNEAGVSDLTKLSQEDKQRVIAIANEAASILGLELKYDASTKEISVYKEGKLIETTTLASSTTLAQTGSTNYAYIVVPAVAIIAIAIAVIAKKAKVNA